ncbi:MAG: hypothetical protein HXX10_23025 [Rhodoplanes sp.]|uniref:hypothetical protein n=1 Tax=Rhodoplanes sp. TaxID=1968906 RepID=UPI00184C988E|nr:hypothetical protein [Rhodoplanes sp.]NVO16909.1 hypothetical protein [Rhodoplanes sp.]
MNEDRTPGTLIGLVVFVGSLGGLFLIARLTHVAMAIAKAPTHVSADAWSQAGLVLIGLLLIVSLAATMRLLIARQRLHHDPVEHSFSSRAL